MHYNVWSNFCWLKKLWWVFVFTVLGVVFCAIELLRKTYKMLGTHLTSSFDIPFGNFWTKKVEIFVTLKIYSVWNPDTLRSDTRKTSDTLKKLTRGFGPFFILHFNCQYGTHLDSFPYTDSDVFFGWYLELFCWYLHLLSLMVRLVLKFKNHEFSHPPRTQ